jgi:hypothetical protein
MPAPRGEGSPRAQIRQLKGRARVQVTIEPEPTPELDPPTCKALRIETKVLS